MYLTRAYRRRESAAAAVDDHINYDQDNSYYCPHISDAMAGLDVDKSKMELEKNKKCEICCQTNELWMCVECKQICCGNILCGHNLAHFERVRCHCIFLNIKSAKLYCYMCGKDVEPKRYDDELHRLREFVLYTPKSTARNNNIKTGQTVNMKRKKSKTTRKRTIKKSRLSIKENDGDTVNVACQAQALPGSTSEPNGKTRKASNTNSIRKKTIIKRIRTNEKVGLVNEGSSCFMNVIWQSLSNINMFTVYLEKLDYNNNLNLFKNKTQLYIVQDLQIILTSLSKWKPRDSNLRNSISARSLYKVVFECSKHVIGEYKQNDAVELLMYVLNKLDSELRQRPPAEGEDKITFSDDPSFATSMFSSMLICRECCQGCGSLYTQRSETNLVISLGIPSEYYNGVSTNSSVGTLTDCLERFFGVEQLQDKRVDCKVCNSSQKSNSKIWISQLPEVLCLHLSRFVYENNQSVKVQTLIQFPMVSLDMSKYVQSENGIAVDREDCLYDLSSVIEHKGNSCNFGHYTSFHHSNHTWYECNDEKVYQVDDSFVGNVEAYVLVYVKKKN